jgi:hypothetical protein
MRGRVRLGFGGRARCGVRPGGFSEEGRESAVGVCVCNFAPAYCFVIPRNDTASEMVKPPVIDPH